MSRHIDGDEKDGLESKMPDESSSVGTTTGVGCVVGVVTALTVNDLDSVLHSVRVNANFKFTPVEKREREK